MSFTHLLLCQKITEKKKCRFYSFCYATPNMSTLYRIALTCTGKKTLPDNNEKWHSFFTHEEQWFWRCFRSGVKLHHAPIFLWIVTYWMLTRLCALFGAVWMDFCTVSDSFSHCLWMTSPRIKKRAGHQLSWSIYHFEKMKSFRFEG